MINKLDLAFDSRDGSSELYATRWVRDDLPQGKPKAILQIVHGMAEYIDRYDDFARYMAEHGLLVTGEDHLGHGKTAGKNGTLGYFCKYDPATIVVRDVHRLKKMTEEDYPGVPYFLLGHSMGSFIARDYLSRYGTGIAGAIIQGTGFQKAAVARFAKALAAGQRLFLGATHPSGLLNAMSFGSFVKGIHPLRTKMDWLSYNTKNVDDYIADPLLGFTFTTNGFETLFDLILRSCDMDEMEKIPRDLPVFITAGVDDAVGDHGKAIKKLYHIYHKTLGMTDVRMKLYPQMRHEILMEDGRETVYEEYLRWIGEHLKDM